MTKQVYIRAHVIDTLPSGQKRVKLLANNADGVEICTDDESIVEDVMPATEEACMEFWYKRGCTVINSRLLAFYKGNLKDRW